MCLEEIYFSYLQFILNICKDSSPDFWAFGPSLQLVNVRFCEFGHLKKFLDSVSVLRWFYAVLELEKANLDY